MGRFQLCCFQYIWPWCSCTERRSHFANVEKKNWVKQAIFLKYFLKNVGELVLFLQCAVLLKIFKVYKHIILYD